MIGIDYASESDVTSLTLINPQLAWVDVLAERERQISAEGWTPEDDDAYQNEDLAKAAACYAMPTQATGFVAKREMPPAAWPWAAKWWKPTNRRRDLVKAAALILAEIERLDRAAKAGRA